MHHALTSRRVRAWLATTNSKHKQPVYPNLRCSITPVGPDELWVADLTYIRLTTGFVFLAVVLDAWSREPGEVGQVLRREGLYSSHLTTWRKAAHSGSLKAYMSKKRGRKPERNPLDEKVRKLERRNARLENELRKAHLIIDVQGKVAGLLGISLDDGTNS